MIAVFLVLPESHVTPPLLLVHRALDDQVVKRDVHLLECLPFVRGHVHLGPFLVDVVAHEDREVEGGKRVIVREGGLHLVWVVWVVGVGFEWGEFEAETEINGVFGDGLPFYARR